jgi:hypothetical protein
MLTKKIKEVEKVLNEYSKVSAKTCEVLQELKPMFIEKPVDASKKQ